MNYMLHLQVQWLLNLKLVKQKVKTLRRIYGDSDDAGVMPTLATIGVESSSELT